MKNLHLGSVFAFSAFLIALTCPAAAQNNSAVTAKRRQHDVAYAYIKGDGTLDTSRSKNIVAFGGGDGLYCFTLTFTPKSAVATLADDPTAPNQGIGFIKTAVPPTPLFTCNSIPNPDAVVETGSETGINSGESQGGYAFFVRWTR
jgi:hypothetical protein